MRLIRSHSQLIAVCIGMISTVLYANEFPDSKQKASIDLGEELSASELENMPGHIFSDGTGLPEGSGTAASGARLYAKHCANCHGSVGQGGKAVELVGDASLLATEYPDKGIAVYWPYAPTLFEYINRSMPPESPGMFSVDELYSIIAHLLELNELIESGFVLNKQTLSNIELPNRSGFKTIAR